MTVTHLATFSKSGGNTEFGQNVDLEQKPDDDDWNKDPNIHACITLLLLYSKEIRRFLNGLRGFVVNAGDELAGHRPLRIKLRKTHPRERMKRKLRCYRVPNRNYRNRTQMQITTSRFFFLRMRGTSHNHLHHCGGTEIQRLPHISCTWIRRWAFVSPSQGCDIITYNKIFL